MSDFLRSEDLFYVIALIIFKQNLSSTNQFTSLFFRVMVMDKGRIGEIDAPSTLLKKKDGIFYQLAVDAGLVEAEAVAGDD